MNVAHLREHLCIVKKNVGPVTVHYREVLLYIVWARALGAFIW